MNLKSKIQQAQRHLIDQLVKYESSIAELYFAFSQAYPEKVNFWLKISEAEKEHARLLQSLNTVMDQGYLFFNLNRFDQGTIDAQIKRVTKETAAVKEAPPSLLQAMAIALSIEASIVDAHFYDTVTSDCPEFKTMADHLARETQQHIKMFQDVFAQLDSSAGGAVAG